MREMTTQMTSERGPRPRRPAAPETQRLYAGDWAGFAAWCAAAGHRALPAAPATVAAHLETLAGTHGYGALARRLAAIADRHIRAGLAAPAIPPQITALLRGLRAQKTREPPPSPARLTRMALSCPGDRRGQRDRALLLLLALGLSRTTLIGLDAEDVRWTTPGMDLTLRPPTGPTSDARMGPPRICAIARHPVLPACPVRALEGWMRASETSFGPVFRKVDRWGNVEHHRLGADAIRRILLSRSRHARGKARWLAPGRGAGGRSVSGPQA